MKTTHQTSINHHPIRRVPDQDGEYHALNTTSNPDLRVEFAPGVPTDPEAFRAWLSEQHAKLNPQH